MKPKIQFDYCVLADRIAPFAFDATSFVVERFINALKKEHQSILVCSKAVQIRKIRIKKIDNITYLLTRDNRIDYQSFASLTKERNVISKCILYLIFFFSKKVFRRELKQSTNLYIKRIKKNTKNIEIKNLIMFCGNYFLCDIVKNKMLQFEKSILLATDYWKFYFSDETFDTIPFDKVFLLESIKHKPKSNVVVKYWKPFFDNLSESLNEKSRVKGKCCFFGGLYKSRDYIKFLNLLNSLKHYNVFVYSGLNTKKIPEYSNINFRKMVFGKEYINALSNTDIFLVLDNNREYRQWIPSKIYEGMSTGRPIILFSDSKTSPTWKVLSNYPLSCFIDVNEDNNEIFNKIEEFIRENSMQISSKKLFDIYPECDAEKFLKNLFN